MQAVSLSSKPEGQSGPRVPSSANGPSPLRSEPAPAGARPPYASRSAVISPGIGAVPRPVSHPRTRRRGAAPPVRDFALLVEQCPVPDVSQGTGPPGSGLPTPGQPPRNARGVPRKQVNGGPQAPLADGDNRAGGLDRCDTRRLRLPLMAAVPRRVVSPLRPVLPNRSSCAGVREGITAGISAQGAKEQRRFDSPAAELRRCAGHGGAWRRAPPALPCGWRRRVATAVSRRG